MADRRPPDGTATQFRSGDEAAKNGRKGGLASGKKRREKRTVQRILSDYLESEARTSPVLYDLAHELGIEDGASIKELVVMKLLINSLEKGDLSDLERLMKLLGEQKETAGAEEKLDALLKEFVEATREDTNDT